MLNLEQTGAGVTKATRFHSTLNKSYSFGRANTKADVSLFKGTASFASPIKNIFRELRPS